MFGLKNLVDSFGQDALDSLLKNLFETEEIKSIVVFMRNDKPEFVKIKADILESQRYLQNRVLELEKKVYELENLKENGND